MTNPITLSTPPAAAPQQDKPRNIEDAAKQFEALLIGQMLRAARDDSDGSNANMMDVAEQHFSKVLANNGGLGLAKLVAQGLHHDRR
ncbi:MAG: hypothetical protein DMG59_00415 [Acidobacteria bacterium]|jgi:Rod binding domain-containing protein|nr:MAG: hypothetical protein DMG59_00415 [Acidobacteriota bacterium]